MSGSGVKQAEVRLRLANGQCVECAARHRFQELLARMVQPKAEVTASESETFDLLRRFLEQTDFMRLRASRPMFDGHVSLTVAVWDGVQPGEFSVMATDDDPTDSDSEAEVATETVSTVEKES